MKIQPFCFEILTVLLLSVIPWPGPSVFKISCPRERTSVVRRIVNKRWIPILKKYQVELPLECPFHKSRDVFHPQQAAKHQHRPSQWTCGLCGKSFYSEKHLDAHFDNRHRSNVNTAEDAVCLADYCDIMRCDILGTRDFESSLIDDSGALNTDIEVWSESTARRTSVAHTEARGDIGRTYRDKMYTDAGSSSGNTAGSGNSGYTDTQQYCRRSETSADASRLAASYQRGITGPDNKSSTDTACDDSDDEEDDEDEDGNLVEAALPDRRERNRAIELQRLKANCKPEELQKLKLQCEVLVRDCIAGLLTNLSVRDFQELEGELNRAICWYLSCDRYWEDTKRQQRHTPWYLLIAFLVLLTIGMSVCYCIVWVAFSSTDEARGDGTAETLNDRSDRTSLSASRSNIHADKRDDDKGKTDNGEESAPSASDDMPEHYIYVAYPPELKRRLLESCYNRTTRL